MKTDIHPDYRLVVFQDGDRGTFLTRSSAPTKDTIEHEGKTLPLIKVDISSASHPFFTGKQAFVDTTGRVDRFQKKFAGKYNFKRKDK